MNIQIAINIQKKNNQISQCMRLLKNVFSLFTCLKWNNYVVQTSHEFMAILHAHQNCIFVIFFVTILQISKLFFQLNVISDLGF